MRGRWSFGGQENRTWTERRRINLTKISKQHWEVKLERFPPECRERGGYNFKVAVIQKKLTDHTSPRKKSEKLHQKPQSKLQLTKTFIELKKNLQKTNQKVSLFSRN